MLSTHLHSTVLQDFKACMLHFGPSTMSLTAQPLHNCAGMVQQSEHRFCLHAHDGCNMQGKARCSGFLRALDQLGFRAHQDGHPIRRGLAAAFLGFLVIPAEQGPVKTGGQCSWPIMVALCHPMTYGEMLSYHIAGIMACRHIAECWLQ